MRGMYLAASSQSGQDAQFIRMHTDKLFMIPLILSSDSCRLILQNKRL